MVRLISVALRLFGPLRPKVLALAPKAVVMVLPAARVAIACKPVGGATEDAAVERWG
jgi:hypothetical protein